uniref:Uncharacterized protein n=1 Tax=Aegilops tauschii subsp. strangulata TaxID=200361 RepID=A0A453CVP3_AEGTS
YLPRDKHPPRPCRLAYGARTPRSPAPEKVSVRPSIHPSIGFPFPCAPLLPPVHKNNPAIALALLYPLISSALPSHTSLLSSLEANSSYPSINLHFDLLLARLLGVKKR